MSFIWLLIAGVCLLAAGVLLFSDDWYKKDATQGKYAAILLLIGAGVCAFLGGTVWGLVMLLP